MAITLPKETRDKALASISRFCQEDLDIDAGQMKATLILDFFLKELGPVVYNHAVGEARSYLERVTGDLEAVCFEKEFTYWHPGGPQGKRR